MAEMNSYYRWCMFFLSVIGLWPYSNNKFRLLHNGIISLVTWASVITNFVASFAVDRNLFQQLRNISMAAMSMVAFTKYHVTWYQIDDVKVLLDEIRLEWGTSNNEVIRIMEIYAFYGKRLVMFFAAFLYSGLCIIILYHISPIILDKIVPLNESRPIKFPVDIELLIEKEQHLIFSISLLYLVIIVDITIFVGTESFMIMFSLHIAGLFGIASYYFQKAVLTESVPSHLPRNRTNNETISYIATGVFVHRKAFQYVHDISKQYNISYIFINMLGVIVASISLFCLSVTVLQLSNIRETIFSLVVLFGAIGYMFWSNLAVEYMIDSASSIPVKTYNTNWYETSIATQKLLQMIILTSNKRVSVNFCSIFAPSIGGFAVLLKTAVSYFTVLLSLQ